MAQRKQIQALSFIALLGIMLILLGRVLLPYLTVLLWSAVTYILISPLYNRLLGLVSQKARFFEIYRRFLAGVFALGTVLMMSGIAVFLGFQLVGQIRVFIDQARTFINENPHFFRNDGLGANISAMVLDISMGSIDLSNLDIKSEMLAFLSSYSNSIAAFTGSVAKNLTNFVVSLCFICFALYFFYLDAHYLANLFISAIPIDSKSTKQLLNKFRDVTKNLFMGFFMVAFYQAIAAFVIFSIFKIQGALLFSFLILFSSFVPMVGCALIWAPLTVTVFLSQGLGIAIAFAVFCSFFISFMDNFLRPLFLKDRIKIHPLLIFFSILGGLNVFGFNGILLGPLVIILFFTIVDIALEEDTLIHQG
ncbi:AI-2E family transporter [Treponema zuelzerae]|uniref:AI-2E family transporter n=1 Tax=Teretinema zuelzerae TaxID=156 RepID=A0AAE3EGY1_9SPIR|nr:AI-2E family transporter [Teretinema zuelzerae]MBN2812288.1 AI-2E family transporter [Spirochaetales bacterium]MCD1654292.1 AI-2E family transporter [Teretinema zuelzerae]HPO01955.1 AI-2E family transporter [Treponemataceae bacterium]